MTKRILPWVVVGFVLTLTGARAICVAQEREAAEPIDDVGPTERAVASQRARAEAVPVEMLTSAEVPEQSRAAEKRTSARSRCEPLDPPYCPSADYACPDMPDGTSRRCRRPYLRPDEDLACLPSVPSKSIKQWRTRRLYTIAGAVGSSSALELGKYLRVLVMRETSLRPWKRHRLSQDVDAAETAWGRRSDVFVGSPAHDEPWRWREGLGYYGQNPALWLDTWDASAEPEVLCGEVEATLVHLRGARKRWRRLSSGIVCEGERFTGTGRDGGPSWYDLSLSNSGSEACPAQPGEGERYEKRLSFERRAKRVGLDPYASVSLKELGEPVAVEEQDAFAEGLYEQLDLIER